MSGPLDQLVDVNITLTAATVSQASFSIPLIVGPTAHPGWTSPVKAYSSLSGMLSDGFALTDPEYKYASAMYSQSITPTMFFVGKRSGGAAVAEVDTFTVTTVVDNYEYSITLNGVKCAYTSAVATPKQTILTGIKTALDAIPGSLTTSAVTGTGNSAILTVTATTAGTILNYSNVDANLVQITTVQPSGGIATDLAAIMASNNDWYGVAIANATDAEILQAASWVEANNKLFIAVSATAAVGTSATTDVASTLKAAGYKRTALVFSPANVTTGIDIAWLGVNLAQTPGANNWAFNQLNGITADTLSANQQMILIGNPAAQLRGKNANIYQTVAGVNITQMGTVASGQFIDITVGLDWLQSQITTNIYTAMVTTPKIPYTDQGTGIIISAVKAAIDQGVVNNVIDGTSPISVSAPGVASVPKSQRTNRVAPTVTFSCRLQGAFNSIIVNGTVSV